MKPWWRRRRWWLALLVLVLAPPALLLFADRWVASSAEQRIHDDPAALQGWPVALVLGTAPTAHGRPNRFYTARIRAAAELYHAGSVRGLLVSGDNGTHAYNEPDTMKADLIAAGVPAGHITCDYAGFRTLDSVVRAKEVFGQERLVVVSQQFHCERAVHLARAHGIDACGFVADDVRGVFGIRVRLRESAARLLAMVDCAIGTEPRFYGPDEVVSLRPSGRSDGSSAANPGNFNAEGVRQ